MLCEQLSFVVWMREMLTKMIFRQAKPSFILRSILYRVYETPVQAACYVSYSSATEM